MCGIAGRILSAPSRVGADVVALMDAQMHRGADSTGFALYGAPLERGFIVRAMAPERASLSAALDEFQAILKAHGSDFLADPTWDDADTAHVSARMVIGDPTSMAAWVRDADEIADRL